MVTRVMKSEPDEKPEPLDERTERFTREARAFVRKLPRTISNAEDVGQLVRSSGSVAANYIEANEALSKKDFDLRIKYCRKESKESRLWLTLLDTAEAEKLETERARLIKEANELKLIFAAILRNRDKSDSKLRSYSPRPSP
jgi:four helix bundle protein